MAAEKPQNNLPSACPKTEELGMYYDVPEDFPEIDAHVKQCHGCRKTIEAYRMLDEAIGEELNDCRPPKELTENIISACAREAEEAEAERIADEWMTPEPETSESRRGYYTAIFRYAASLLAVAALSALVTAKWITSAPAHQNEVSLAENAAAVSFSPAAAFSLADSRRVLDSAPVNSSRGTIPVAIGQSQPGTSGMVVPRLSIPRDVTHVWISGEANGAKGLNLLSDNAGLFKEVNTASEGGITTWEIQCSDENLQRVADSLYAKAGWELLSPTYPQPGEGDSVAFSGKNVNYTLKLIQK